MCSLEFNETHEKWALRDSESPQNIWNVMKCEAKRVNSFSKGWPLSYIKPSDLAADGLFYFGFKDVVQCAFCRVTICNWIYGQTSRTEHMRKSPNCPFLFSNQQNNPLEHSKSESLLNWEILKCVKPVNQTMVDIGKRYETFKLWPKKKPNVKNLVECGLYYTGFRDFVLCFACGGLLAYWEDDDDPIFEHIKFFPDCKYVNFIMKSEKRFLRTCEKLQKYEVEEISIPETSFLLKEVYRNEVKDQGRIEISQRDDVSDFKSEVRTSFLCKICMDREMNIVFQPCGHLMGCRKCVENLQDCPLCRRAIFSKISTFLS